MATVMLQVMKQVSPETAKPYRLFETFLTSEGARSRVCSGVYVSEEEACARRAELESKAGVKSP